MKYYVLLVVEDLEPELQGPYPTEQARDARAIQLKAEDEDQENGIYSLDVAADGTPTVHAYTGGFLSGHFKAVYDAEGNYERIAEVVDL